MTTYRRSSTWKVSYAARGLLPNLRRNLPAIVFATAEVMRQEWIRAARSSLSRTAAEYIRNIGPIVTSNSGRTAIIKLFGWLPNALEEGKGSFDLKPGLLKGPNAKRSESGAGYYNTIPFSHTTPGTAPVTAMPTPIYRMAKNMPKNQALRLTGTALEGYGQRSKISTHYTWKTSPYEGMVRRRMFEGMPTQSPAGRLHNYKTFRRVSSKSDPNSWIHPGFRAHDIMDRAAEATDRRFGEIVESMVTA